MESNWLSQLKDVRSKLESELENLESGYESDRQALERRYKDEKEPLQQALKGVQVALGTHSESDTTSGNTREKEDQTGSSLPVGESSAVVSFNGAKSPRVSAPSEQADTVAEQFSTRREIEKLLSEFATDQDVIQGEIRHELEKRFPQHKDLFKAATVSSILRRLASAGSLVLVSKGAGSEPNIYRLPDRSNGSQDELSELRE